MRIPNGGIPVPPPQRQRNLPEPNSSLGGSPPLLPSPQRLPSLPQTPTPHLHRRILKPLLPSATTPTSPPRATLPPPRAPRPPSHHSHSQRPIHAFPHFNPHLRISRLSNPNGVVGRTAVNRHQPPQFRPGPSNQVHRLRMPQGIGALPTGFALRRGWPLLDPLPERANPRFTKLLSSLHHRRSQHRCSQTQRFDSQHFGSIGSFQYASIQRG